MNMYRRTKEELEKFIKKTYHLAFIDEILNLYNEISQLKNENEILKSSLDDTKKKLSNIENSDEYKFSGQLSKFIDCKINSALDKDLSKVVGREVKKHLDVSVYGYYEEFSDIKRYGADINWN